MAIKKMIYVDENTGEKFYKVLPKDKKGSKEIKTEVSLKEKITDKDMGEKVAKELSKELGIKVERKIEGSEVGITVNDK